MSYAHPGSIQARVGAALAGIELNIEQQDHNGINNFTDLLMDYTSVYLEEDENGLTEMEKFPPINWEDDPEPVVMDKLRKRRRFCLRVLREQNIFGYVGAPPLGNSDVLKSPLGEIEA